MPESPDIHGAVFKNGSATLLARVVGEDGAPVTRASLVEAVYTVYGPGVDNLVAGHDNVSVEVSALIYDTLQTDALWDQDTTGYNFRHVLDVSRNPAFATAQTYRVVFRLSPPHGPIIFVRFRLYAI